MALPSDIYCEVNLLFFSEDEEILQTDIFSLCRCSMPIIMSMAHHRYGLLVFAGVTLTLLQFVLGCRRSAFALG